MWRNGRREIHFFFSLHVYAPRKAVSGLGKEASASQEEGSHEKLNCLVT